MTRLGAIDIETNTPRLLVAEQIDSETKPLLRIERYTRLGAGVDANRLLDKQSIKRTLDALREFRTLLSAHEVDKCRAVATSASRDAFNRDDFFEPAAEILGTSVELIDGQTEAALGFAGARLGLPNTKEDQMLVVDIGGGSTEFVLGAHEPTGAISVDIGSVRLTEQHLSSDPPAPEELSNALALVRDHLADVDRALPGAKDAQLLVGLAGTVSTMAAIEIGLQEHDVSQLHHFRLTRAAAEEVFRTLATEPLEQRKANPGLAPERADVILGGAVIVVSIMRCWDFHEILVSETDLLDGLILLSA